VRQNQCRDVFGRFRIGDACLLKGDVTSLSAIRGKSAFELELGLGFHPGRLALGFALLQLIEPVSLGDFTWGGTTQHSGGWICEEVVWRDKSGGLGSSFEYVKVQDSKRGSFLVSGSDPSHGDRLFDSFMRSEQLKLNQPPGGGHIVKVVPHIPHFEHVSGYPNSPAGGVPQWTLARKKLFRCVAVTSPDG
jgi:hypothetical protein